MKGLVTIDKWFMAPDGDMYQAVFGEIVNVAGDFILIGEIQLSMRNVISIVNTEECKFCEVDLWEYSPSTGLIKYKAPCRTYDTTKKANKLNIVK